MKKAAALIVPKPTLEEVFVSFLTEVSKAPDLVSVNIAAGIALEDYLRTAG